jgi:hypothetical protein
MGHRDQIKSVAGQGEWMRLHEQPTPQFIADDHVAADRNVCGARSHIEYSIRADDFQRDRGVFFTPFRQLRDQPFAGECARARHVKRRLHILFCQQRHRRGQRIEAVAQGRIEACPGACQEQRPRAPLEQLYSAGLFQLSYLVADCRRRDAELGDFDER